MPAETREPERYRVADLLVDVAIRRVARDGREIPLPGLSFDLLLALIRRNPSAVSADELMNKVWPGRVINAETVAKRVELVRELWATTATNRATSRWCARTATGWLHQLRA